MIVGKAHEKILKALREQPCTMDELVKKTGYSRDGLRGRVSEMRKMGFEIEYVVPKEKEYVLVVKPKDKILKWLKENKKYGMPVNINVISNALNISRDVVEFAIAEMFDTHNIIQFTNDSVVIREKGDK